MKPGTIGAGCGCVVSARCGGADGAGGGSRCLSPPLGVTTVTRDVRADATGACFCRGVLITLFAGGGGGFAPAARIGTAMWYDGGGAVVGCALLTSRFAALFPPRRCDTTIGTSRKSAPAALGWCEPSAV